MAAQPVHGDLRATQHHGLSPGTGRGSVTTIPSPPSPEGTWSPRPLSVSVDRLLLYPQSPAPGLSVCDPCSAAPLHSNPAAPLAPSRSICVSFQSSKPAPSASTPGRREWAPSSGTWSPSLPYPHTVSWARGTSGPILLKTAQEEQRAARGSDPGHWSPTILCPRGKLGQGRESKVRTEWGVQGQTCVPRPCVLGGRGEEKGPAKGERPNVQKTFLGQHGP